jgi:hypothetical protein
LEAVDRPAKKKQVKLLCLCQMPEDERVYVGCELCKGRYHIECLAAVHIDVPVTAGGKVERGFQFTCVACRLKKK